MSDDRFDSDHPYRPNTEEAALLFVYHLGCAITMWEIGAVSPDAINRAAKNLPFESYRAALYKLMSVLHKLWNEPGEVG